MPLRPWPFRSHRPPDEAERRVKPASRSPLRTAAGVCLLALGVVGLALPLVPGWPFLLAAAFVLGRNHPYVRPFSAWLEKRVPKRRQRGAPADDSMHEADNSMPGEAGREGRDRGPG